MSSSVAAHAPTKSHAPRYATKRTSHRFEGVPHVSEHHRRTLPTAPRRGRLKPSLAGTAALALIASGITLAATPAQAAYTLADATNPDFGSNVTIFDDSMPAPSIQSTLRAAASSMAGDANHWSTERRAFFLSQGHMAQQQRQYSPRWVTTRPSRASAHRPIP